MTRNKIISPTPTTNLRAAGIPHSSRRLRVLAEKKAREKEKERDTRREMGLTKKGGNKKICFLCRCNHIFTEDRRGDQSVRPISLENTDEDATYARVFPFLFCSSLPASRILHAGSFVKSFPFCAKSKFRETAMVGGALACKSHHYYQVLNGVS